MRIFTVLFVLSALLLSCDYQASSTSINGKYVPKHIQNSNFGEVVSDSLKLLPTLTNVEVIEIPKMQDRSLQLSNIIDSIWYLPLETKTESLFGDISKIYFVDSSIIIWDQLKTESVLCFDACGNFKNKIGNKGKGPSEFIKPSHVAYDYDKKNVLILDGFRNSIISYGLGGQYLSRSKRLGFSFRGFEKVGDMIIYDTEYAYNDYLPEIRNHLILCGNKGYQIIAKGLPYTINRSEYDLYHTFVNLFHVGDEFYYRPPLWDTIYSVSHNAIAARYALKYESNGLPDDFRSLSMNEFDKVITNKAFPVRRFFISKKYIWFMVEDNGQRKWCLYHRIKHKLATFNQYENDLEKGILLSPFPIALNGDTVVTEMPAYQFKELQEMYNEKHKGGEVSNNVGITDNSVLVFYVIDDNIFN